MASSSYTLGAPLPEDVATTQKKPALKGQAPGGSGTTIQPTVPTTSSTIPTMTPTGGGTPSGIPSQPKPVPTIGAGIQPGPGLQPISQNMNPSQNGLYTNPGTAQQTPVAGTGPQVASGVSNPTGGLTGGMTPAVMPGPGTTPIGPGMNPGAPPVPSNPYMTEFAPGNDLRFQQINPYGDERLQGTQGAVDSAVSALQGGPNRQALAQSLFADYIAQSQSDFDRSLREITQRNAAGGRLGSGMYGSDLVDAATARQQDLVSYATRLAYDTAGGDIQDRLNNVNTLAGLEGQQFGQGAAQRNELRGERTYQQGVAAQAQQDAINQRLLEDQLLNSEFGRDYQRYGMLGQLGYGSNPAGTLGGLAGDTQGAANQAGQGANDLFMQWLLGQSQGG